MLWWLNGSSLNMFAVIIYRITSKQHAEIWFSSYWVVTSWYFISIHFFHIVNGSLCYNGLNNQHIHVYIWTIDESRLNHVQYTNGAWLTLFWPWFNHVQNIARPWLEDCSTMVLMYWSQAMFCQLSVNGANYCHWSAIVKQWLGCWQTMVDHVQLPWLSNGQNMVEHGWSMIISPGEEYTSKCA